MMVNTFAVIKLLLQITLEIVDAIKKRKNAGDIRLRDLPGWKRWRRRIMKPDFSKALSRLKKGKK